MSTAIDTPTLQNFIDGAFVDPAEGATTPVIDPATGEEIAQAPDSTSEDVDRAVAAAKRAFDAWANTTPGERSLMLLELADAIEEHGDEIAELEARNAGKPLQAVKDDEIPAIVDPLRFFAGAARLLEGRAAGEYSPGFTSWVRREPAGVVGQIAPWNYPLMMAIWKIGPALAAGCPIVLKPAPTTPVTALKLAELAAEILPPGVLNVVAGGNQAGAHLVEHPDIDMVSLTGSVETGKWIAEHAAKTLKRVHLELGGKAPVIVFDDVDLQTAMESIAGFGYYNAGQDCTAATRVLASADVYDDVVNGLAGEAKGYVMGDTMSPDTTLGPLSSARQGRHRRQRARPPRLLPGADGGGQPAAGRRHDPARDLRPGHHRPALQRRAGGDRLGQRHPVRARLLGVDARRGPGAAGLQGAALRRRVDQQPRRADQRDAPRRLQAERLRQGPLDVLGGGLHGGQARDGVARLAAPGQDEKLPPV
jgi:betaine-aldehyde dehydrogenase